MVMSSSSFSFSSSGDEGVRQADGASASEGRIVVAASRALSNPSTGERDAGAEKGGNVDANDGGRKRKSSGRKRHRKNDRRRKRSDSCLSDGSDPSSDDDEEHRRKHRKKHKSKKDRKRESKRDREKRRRKNYRGSHSESRSRSRSRSRGRTHDDTSRGAGSKKEEGSVGATAEIRLPKPSSGRSFASVSKGIAEVRPQSPKLLMIEDGRAEDDGTRVQQQQIEAKQSDDNIDFVRAFREASLRQCQNDAEKERQYLLLPIDYEGPIEDESGLNKLYLDQQKRLNETVRTNPTDTVAWIALANLNQPEPKARDSSAKEIVGAGHERKDVARLERKREILTRGVKNNLECYELRIALIETMERLCSLSAIPEKNVEAENDAAIRMFEVLVAEENKSHLQEQQGRSTKVGEHSSNVPGLIALHRMRLRRHQRHKECTANKLRDGFIDAFASVSKACGVTESVAPPPAEMSVLFLDYLRAEALLGYSERAVALIQAALEINLYRNSNDGKTSTNISWESSFFDYWNSESSRIGEVYPHAGWLRWDKAENLHSEGAKLPASTGRKRKAKKRLRASDFFAESSEATSTRNDASVNQEAKAEVTKDEADGSIDRAQILASAYASASSATQSNEGLLPTNTQESAQVVGHILGAAKSAVEKQEERTRRREQEELEIFGENGKGVASEAAVFAADGTDIAVSDVKHSKPTHAYVYSYILNRRIEVSLDELSGQATRDTLRSTLLHLRARKKKHGANNPSNVTKKPTDEKLYIIQEDDTFLRWAMEEAKTQDFIFLLPRKSLHDEKERAEFYDPNERVWVEDGIQWIVTPYLSPFSDVNGVPYLVSACLQFLGVFYPRSLMGDSFGMNRYVMGTAGGGERVGQSILSETFNGVLKPSDGQRMPSLPSDPFLNIYRQLLLDDATIIAFDERIFHPDNEKQRTFLRNCLYAIATSTDKQTGSAESEPSWHSYIQIALIAFEGRASGEKAAEVARSILEGTREAKCDPRLIIAYAMLDYNLQLSRDPSNASKAFKSASKILLRAMEAGGSNIFESPYSSWWFELALMTVRSMMEIPIGATSEKPSEMTSFPTPAILSPEQRDRILHVICCAIEGSYQPLPKEKSKKKNKEAVRSAALVDEGRMRKCMLTIRKKMASSNKDDVETLSFSHHQSAEVFDRTPTIFYLAILSAWLAALDPKRCKGGGIDFTSGISLLDDFASVKVPTREGDKSSFQTFLLRVAHAKLELSILRSHEWGESRILPSSPFADCLVKNVAQLKSLKIAPSKSLMLAMAHLENQHSQRVKNGYSDLLVPDLDIGGIHPNEILFLLEKAVASADKTINGPNLLQTKSMARCSCWTKDGRKMVEEAILTAISRSTYCCCYPSLYSALLQVSLLGSVQSKRPSRAFHKTKDLYHNKILPSCSFSKGLWLDAFTLLRPTYSEVEMVYHMAAMEEKDIRLRKGLEGVMRIAGAKTTND